MIKEDFIKAYKGDLDTSERVFKEYEELQSKPTKSIKFSVSFRNRTYTIFCSIPLNMSIEKYLGEYILIRELVEENKVKPYALKEFLRNNGNLGFYFKMKLEFIKNIIIFVNN